MPVIAPAIKKNTATERSQDLLKMSRLSRGHSEKGIAATIHRVKIVKRTPERVLKEASRPPLKAIANPVAPPTASKISGTGTNSMARL